jgi:hypothetical protein
MPYKPRDFTARTRATVLQRAIDIVRNRGVFVLDHDDDHAQCHVQNNQGGIYHVEIRYKNREVAFTHCDCPYRGVGLCKHTAASILQLLVNDGFKPLMIDDSEFITNDADVEEENEDDNKLRELIQESTTITASTSSNSWPPAIKKSSWALSGITWKRVKTSGWSSWLTCGTNKNPKPKNPSYPKGATAPFCVV